MESNRYDPMSVIDNILPTIDTEEKELELGKALYALFCNFKNSYREEWERMKRNETLYHAKHWEVMETPGDKNAPKPVTPIIFSTIENVKADLMNKIPAGTIKPENSKDQDLARALTKVCQQDLEANDWEYEYYLLTDDLLKYGWNVMETGFDPYAMQGKGCAYIRRVAPFSFMCDPVSENPQDGRACFKFAKRTREWFRQHYPEKFDTLEYDPTIDETYRPDTDIRGYSPVTEVQEIVECWVKCYDRDRKRTSVHMITFAGEMILEHSCKMKPGGYYAHGEYPFIVTPLYPVSGTPWGLGIPDMHEASQIYSDKLDQILLKNAYLSSHNKLLVTDASGFDAEDLSDWTKDVHQGESLNGVTWFSTPPLPSYLLSYLMEMRAAIKTESGANDQARGQTSGGVTAASAINALQVMATKRSTMHAQGFHSKFKMAYRMLLDVEREFAQSDREVVFMSHGRQVSMLVTPEDFKRIGDDGKPIEYHIVIETSDVTQYTKLSNNELALQLGTMYRDTIDPIAVLYLMDFPDKDIVIEMIQESRNSQLIVMQQQIAQMQQLIDQLVDENKKLKAPFARKVGADAEQAYRQQAMAQLQQRNEQPALSEEEQNAMLENMSNV